MGLWGRVKSPRGVRQIAIVIFLCHIVRNPFAALKTHYELAFLQIMSAGIFHTTMFNGARSSKKLSSNAHRPFLMIIMALYVASSLIRVLVKYQTSERFFEEN